MSNLLISVHNINLFWTTGIYYAAEFSKHYRTTLLLENCSDTDIAKIQRLTEGRVQDIVCIEKANGLNRHRQYRDVAKKVVSECQPDIVVSSHDEYPPDLYVLRESGHAGSVNVCFQVGVQEGCMADMRVIRDGAYAASLASRTGLPYEAAFIGGKTINIARHVWHYWLAPVLVGQQPFPGRSSVFLHTGETGMRDSDYLIVFSERDKQLYLESGTRAKTVVIPHPLTWQASKPIAHRLFGSESTSKQDGEDGDQGLLLLSQSINEFAISRETGRQIARSRIYADWKSLVDVIAQKFPDFQVLVKPHPAQSDNEEFLLYLREVVAQYPRMKFVDKKSDTWALVAKSKVIVAETSTVLFATSMMFPEKVIISVDLQRRLLGDVFKKTPHIIYFDDLDEFARCDLASNRVGQSIITDGDQKLLAFVESLLQERDSKRGTRK